MAEITKSEHKLFKKILITGEITTLTGLHIGGTNNAMTIGGVDSGVIRNPLNDQPYIPGSSIKGKMRSLLEIAHGYIVEVNMGRVKYGGSSESSLITAQLFGTARGDDQQRPSRVIARDGALLNTKQFEESDFYYTETKTEVVIDRITSAAMPRKMERVPAGAKFSLGIVLNVFEGDDEKRLLDAIFKSLQLVQDDYLGGHGSRGSGQVDIVINQVLEKDRNYYTTQSSVAPKEWGSEDMKSKVPADLLRNVGIK